MKFPIFAAVLSLKGHLKVTKIGLVQLEY